MTLLLAASIIPPFFLLWKVYQSDKIEKEPLKLLFVIFLLGMLSTIPAGILEMVGEMLLSSVIPESARSSFLLQTVYRIVFYVIVVGGAEEFVKFLAMRIPTWRSREFNYVFDGVVYGVTAALGFAALENVFYVLDGGMSVAGIRAWTAIPLHCIAGIYMGHYYGIAKAAERWNSHRERSRFMRLSVLIPMLIHGAYDFIATSPYEILSLLFFVYIVILDIFAFRSLNKYSQYDVRLE